MGVPGTGPRRSCYSDTGMLAMPLSKVTEILRKYPCKRGGPCRDDSSETRAAIAEVLVREKPGNYAKDLRAACISPRVRRKEGPGTAWGAASRGASLEKAIRSTLEDVRNGSTEGRKRARRKILRERGSARGKEERRGRRRWRSESGLRRVLSTQDRHPATCQQTLPTREEHVGEKSPGKHEDGESAAR